MALGEHLMEARKQLMIAASSVIAGTIGGFFVYMPVLEALAQPMKDLNERKGRTGALNFDVAASPFRADYPGLGVPSGRHFQFRVTLSAAASTGLSSGSPSRSSSQGFSSQGFS